MAPDRQRGGGGGAEAVGRAAPAEGPGSAGRPRSEEAHQAILQATLELLSEVGYSALTVEGVATRAGVGKATIYRRWPSKLPLVVEAFGQLPGFEDVDTGSLEGDLKAMLRSYLELFHKSPLPAVLPSLAGERASNPELAQLFGPVMRGRREPLMRVLERGRDRGELPADLDLGLASELLVGPIAVRLFFTGRSLHPDLVDPIVDLALEGLRRGGRRP
ncbi:MAG: TetR/AcrR family transcriptional regulator [Myxococcota bacterium]|nr:TetR/AcrR family transcriptional regulator [Myxococcota bacterium]